MSLLKKRNIGIGSGSFAVARWALGLLLLLGVVLSSAFTFAQSGLDDDRIMLQGFYWESYRHGHPEKKEFALFGDKTWYEIVRNNSQAIREGHIDLVWLPPPSYAGKYSAGYNPKQYFKLDNSYGTFAQHREALEALLQKGVEPVADIVINHRDGNEQWGDFKNPNWGPWAICRSDEAFTVSRSELYNLPEEQRGPEEDRPTEYRNGDMTYQYCDFRDICHSDARVRRDIVRYLKQLQSLGYRGWRYDMAHGYAAKWAALYNKATRPTFSVGEYDWNKQGETRGWIWHSATTSGDFSTASDAFDFSTQIFLKDHKMNYNAWYAKGNGVGLVGDNKDGVAWKNRAVTFLENHDTGYRTEEDGSPQKGHESDKFANNWEVEQGYAYILTHPGVPCIYWKHYFDWGSELQRKIKALTNARKVAGVHAGSNLNTQHNAQATGVYAAMIEGKRGKLYVRIGGDDNAWQPSASGYSGYREYAAGDGWKVWVGLPGDPPVQQAAFHEPFPVPTYVPAENIDVPDALINSN